MIRKLIQALTSVSISAAILTGCGGGGHSPQMFTQPQAPASNQILYSATARDGLGTVTAYSIDPQRGTLTPLPGSPFVPSNRLLDVERLLVDPNNSFLFLQGVSFFTITTVSDPLLVFPLNHTTGLIDATTMELPTGNLSDVILHPSGKFLYFNVAARGPIGQPGYGGVKAWSFPASGTTFTQLSGITFRTAREAYCY